ncbi:MAG: PD40 domain-containing protein, partial [Candidatus Saccharimonas sp.]|nr:PD40 domain-containing protein [Planctomycetaceae bacterium]
LALSKGDAVEDWSADGQWLAVRSRLDSQIYLVKPDGSGRRRLANSIEYSFGHSSFSPDSRRIVYLSRQTLDDKSRFSLRTININGTGDREILGEKKAGSKPDSVLWTAPMAARWSPNGKHLAVVLFDHSDDGGFAAIGGNWRLVIIDADGGNLRELKLEGMLTTVLPWDGPEWRPVAPGRLPGAEPPSPPPDAAASSSKTQPESTPPSSKTGVADADKEQSATAVGTVVAPDNKPMAGIEVLVFQGAKQLEQKFTTDEKGEFRVPKVWREVDHWLTLVARDGRERLGWFDFMIHGHSDIGQKSEDGSFRLVLLPMSRTIRGRVLDESGQPLAQIPVRINQLDHEVNSTSVHWRYQKLGDEALVLGAVTDNEGRFELKLPANTSAWLGTSHPDWVEQRIRATKERDDVGDTKLVRAAKVAGRVIDSRTGKPLAGVMIGTQMNKPNMAESEGYVGTTDANGNYVIEGLTSGEFTIFLFMLDGSDPTLTAPAIPAATLKKGDTFQADFSLSVGKRLAGRVLDIDTGKPIAGCKVKYSGPARPSTAYLNTETNKFGEFEFFVPPGRSSLDATEGRRFGNDSTRTVDVPADGDPEPVVLKVGEETESVPGSFKIFIGPPLDRKVSLHFQRAPLFEVLEHACQAAAVKLELDGDGLKSVGYTKNMAVTIDSDNVTLRDALTQVLKPYEKLSFTLDKDQIFVSNRQQVEAREAANKLKSQETSAVQSPDIATDGWGKELNGLRTRVTSLTEKPAVGQPLRVKIELQNIGKAERTYQSQRADPDYLLDVVGPDGKPAEFIKGGSGIPVQALKIKPDETVVLREDVDVASMYLLANPGRYEIKLRGPDRFNVDAAGPERAHPNPASNTLAVTLADGMLNDIQATFVRIRNIAPKDWNISTRGNSISNIQKSITRRGEFLLLFTKERQADDQKLGGTIPYEYLGLTRLGHAYLAANPQAKTEWPECVEKIREQLPTANQKSKDLQSEEQRGQEPRAEQKPNKADNVRDETHPKPEEVFARTVSLDAKEMPLRKALAELARAARVPLKLDEPALAEAKLDLNAPVTVTITDEALSVALLRLIDWNAHQGVYRELRGGALFLTTIEAAKERTKRVLPDWLKPISDQQRLHATIDGDNQIVAISAGEALTDELLARLKSLPKLHELSISGTTKLTPAGLAHLAELTELEKLSLSGFNETEDGLADVALKHIVGLKSLRELRLRESWVTDAGIQLLEGMPQLTLLEIYQEGRLTDGAIASIAKLKRLKYLSLTCYVGTKRWGFMRFSPEALRQLSVLQELKVLTLPGQTVPADFFLEFPGLTSLDLQGEFVTDATAERIAQRRALNSLSLSRTRITDEGWKKLATLPELRRLSLTREKITDDGIAHLKALPRLNHLELRTGSLTDEALGHLAEIKSLTQLDLWGGGSTFGGGGSDFTVVGLQQLKGLPKLRTLWLTNLNDRGSYAGLKELTQLRELVFEMATINQQQFNDLETALPETRISAGTGGGHLRSIRRPNEF